MSDTEVRPARQGRRRGALRLGAVTALVTVWALSSHTATGQEIDARTFSWVAPLHDAVGGPAALLRRGLPAVGSVIALGLALVAVRARRWRTLAGTGGLLVVAPATALVARTFLERPDLGDHGYAHNTFPSLNVTVVTALCVTCVVLWPASARPAVLVAGGVTVVLAALASAVTYAHRGSDVIGAILLVVALAPAGVLAARPIGLSTVRRRVRRHSPPRPS